MMKALKSERYRCAVCGWECREQVDISLVPPDPTRRLFFCENLQCPEFGKAFIDAPQVVEVEQVKLQLAQ